MDHEFRVIVEKVSISSQQVVKRDTVKIYDIKQPESILDLGLRHEEQISLLAKVQNALLSEQSALIDLGFDSCPKCGRKIFRNGFIYSKFHAVFSDHKIRIQKHRCKNPECGWQSTPTTNTVFGTDTHPDLHKLQCEQGTLHSYREAQDNLEKLNCQRRSVNNHVRIQQITNQVGERLAQRNLNPPHSEELPIVAEELIVQVEEGHIPAKTKDKKSFAVLSAVVYRPNNVERVDQHHRRITDKSCVLSAMDDELVAIKTYLNHAALKQGLNRKTDVTALSDGAENCWSAISVLEPHCHSLELILDWLHITRKFQKVKYAVSEDCEESLEKVRWSLWHGKADQALREIDIIQSNLTDERKRTKLKDLHEYLKRNLDYLVNYAERKKVGKPFTSNLTDSHIDTIVNARHGRKRKMQWTYEGAHNVLQIRALMISNEWEENWTKLVLAEELEAA